MSILRLNEFTALPGQFENLVEQFDALIEEVRVLPGCERCELLLKVADGNDDDDRLVILEVWTSISHHKAAASAGDPQRIKAILALLSHRPSGQYYSAVEDPDLD